MASYCRICHDENRGNKDTLVACNNCGSLACAQHHTWWKDSKNAFCTVCFPKTLIASLKHTQSGLQSLNDDNMAAERFRSAIDKALSERQLSLDELIALLGRIVQEIRSRMKEGE